MRTICGLLLLATFATVAYGSFRSVSPVGNALTSPLKRKPFVSPEQTSTYKRIKRESAAKSVLKFQEHLKRAKETCGASLGFQPAQLQKSLLYVDKPSPKESCLIECILKRVKIMGKNNRLSTQSVGRIAEMVSNNNPLVVQIAIATAENCNRLISTTDPCAAAAQINKCIANEMQAHKVKIHY